jgi:threonine synthase
MLTIRASSVRVARCVYCRGLSSAISTRLFSALPKGAALPEKQPTPTKSQEETPLRVQSTLDTLPVTFSDISRAKVAINGGVRRTELFKSFFLSELIGANIYLKPEVQQFTGSFKERGARNAILKLMRERGPSLKGVIAASAGNHALALAYHGKELGVPVTVVMPVVAPLAKVDKCRKFGARVIIEGAHILEAKTYAETLVAKDELTYVNGYDDPAVVSGAGTIGELSKCFFPLVIFSKILSAEHCLFCSISCFHLKASKSWKTALRSMLLWCRLVALVLSRESLVP